MFILNLQAEFIDFGIQGKQYPIAEENGNDIIQESIKSVNWTMVEKDLNDKIDKYFYSQESFQDNIFNDEIFRKDFVLAQHDVFSLDGKLIYRAGDKILSSIPDGAELNLCFIDGSDKKEVIEEIINSFGECIYFVNNIDSRHFENIYGKSAYPIGGQNKIYSERFKITHLPTKITKIKDGLFIKNLDISLIRKKHEN